MAGRLLHYYEEYVGQLFGIVIIGLTIDYDITSFNGIIHDVSDVLMCWPCMTMYYWQRFAVTPDSKSVGRSY